MDRIVFIISVYLINMFVNHMKELLYVRSLNSNPYDIYVAGLVRLCDIS